MLSFFPTPYPDELLYSIIARYHIRSGNISSKMTLKELFGISTITAVIDLPSHIDVLARALPEIKIITSNKIIDDNTLFPYYAAFLPEERFRTFKHAMKGSKGGSIHTMTGIMASSITTPQYLRFCPICFNEDMSMYGEGYWHRLHQVPGVLLCPAHNTELLDSIVSMNRQNRHEFIAAIEENCIIGPFRIKYCDQDIERHLNLSKDVEWVIKNYKQIHSAVRSKNSLRDKYIFILKEKGYSTVNGRVYQKQLIEDFINFYGTSFLKLVQSEVDYNEENNWLSSIVRKHRKSFHPLRHLLLIRFLMGEPQKFFSLRVNSFTSQNELNYQRNSAWIIDSETCENKKGVYRDQWLELKNEHPNMSKTELRSIGKAVYTWLYRHDKKWLEDNSPFRKPIVCDYERVDWGKRDKLILVKIKKAVCNLTDKSCKPYRLNMSRIGKKAGILNLLEKNINKMPLSKQYLQSVIESKEEFQLRRIVWAAEQINKKNEEVKAWKIIRKAAMRPNFSQKVESTIMEMVSKYNCNISNQII